jgi:tetratricopeptide (TPR) repeat protein
MYNNKTKTMIDKAWKARENGDPVLAIAILYPLFYEQYVKGKYLKSVNILGDIATSYRVLAGQTKIQQYITTAYETITFAESVAKEKNIDLSPEWNFFVANCLMDLKKYKEAIDKYENFLSKQEWSRSKRMEVQASIGLANYYLGNVKEANKMVNESVAYLKTAASKNHLDKNLTLIWLTGAMIKQAEIQNSTVGRKKILQEALEIAKLNNLGARERQLESTIKGL